MSGDGGSPGQQQHGGQPQGPGVPGPEAPGPGGTPGAAPGGAPGTPGTPGTPGHWPGYGPAFGQPGWSTGGGWGQGPWGGVPVAPKPGVLPLRPLGFGEKVGIVFDTVRRHVGPLYLPLAVVAGIGAVPLVATSFLIADSFRQGIEDFPDLSVTDPTPEQAWNLLRPLLPFFGLVVLVAAALYVVAGPLATVVLRAATLGRKVTAGQAWREARPRLSTSAAVLALVYGPLLLLEALLTVGTVLVGDVFSLPFLLVVFGGLYVTFRLAPQIPVTVLEESDARTAIRRAWQLNRNNWWRSFGVITLVSFLGMVGTMVLNFPLRIFVSVALPIGVATSGDEQAGTGLVALALVVSALVVLVATLATSPLVPLANGVLYIDRRIRNERLDIALAEAAGIRFAESYGHPAHPAHPAHPSGPARTVPAQSAPAEPARPAEPVRQPEAVRPSEPARPAEPVRPSEPPAGEGSERS